MKTQHMHTCTCTHSFPRATTVGLAEVGDPEELDEVLVGKLREQPQLLGGGSPPPNLS